MRRSWVDELLARPDLAIDWLEIIPENFIRCSPRTLRALAALVERYLVVPHGLGLSVGGVGPLDREYLDAVRALVSRLDAPYWTDHLSYACVDGVHTHELLPLPRSAEAVEHAAQRARTAAAVVGVPLALENVSVYAQMPGDTMDEASFVRAALEAADCDLLLDVNNVLVNATNLGHDAEAVIDAMPMDRVRHIHVAGHEMKGALAIDTHRGPTPDAVWALYRRALRRAGRIIPTIVEWDTEMPSLDAMVAEVDRARKEAGA